MVDAVASDYGERSESAGPFEIHIVTYRIGERYYCKVDNVSPGAVIARAEGTTREEAETAAVAVAKEALDTTRVRR